MSNLNPGMLPGQKIVIGPDDAPDEGKKAVLGLSNNSNGVHLDSELIPINEPEGLVALNEEGIIPARVSVLEGTLEDIGDVVLGDGELAVQRDANGGVIGLRAGDGVASMSNCPIAGDAWEVDDSDEYQGLVSPADYILYQTSRMSTVNTGRGYLSVEGVFFLVATGTEVTVAVGAANGTAVPGITWTAIRSPLSPPVGTFDADSEHKPISGSATTLWLFITGRTLSSPSAGNDLTVRITNPSGVAIQSRRFRKRL